jgi:protein TonB
MGSAYRSSEPGLGTDVSRSSRGSRAVTDHPGQIEVSSGMMAGYLLSAPKPDYPGLARIAHIGGPVVLQAVVGKNGSVLATHVLSGHRLLRGAAQDAVRQWRFKPYMMDGHPVEVSTIVTVRFNSKR